MSKKTNTILFILGATVVNILITIISFFVLYILYARVLAPRLPPNSVVWGIMIIFVAALAISFIVYQTLLKQFVKKVEVQKYFDPIFNSRKK
jgi:putative effector of murein hydrolase